MKSIGICTWYKSPNFGTQLQAYALQHKLDSLGYDAYLVEYVCRKLKALRFIYRKFFRRKIAMDEKSMRLESFCSEILKVWHIDSIRRYRMTKKRFNVFISGSDQIWNPNYLNGFYLLDWCGNKKRISYASSVGVAKIPENKKKFYKAHLEKFSAISLREQTGCDELKMILPQKEIKKALDPTFLLESNDWGEFAEKSDNRVKKYTDFILCYLIGKRDEYKRQVEAVWNKTGIKNLVVIASAENPDFKIDGAILINWAVSTEFVYLLKKATLVITDSFHATALCMNNSVDFVEFLRFDDSDEKSQNSRIYELLAEFGLQNRFYKDGFNFSKEIDYKPIQENLCKLRKESIDFLIGAIEG